MQSIIHLFYELGTLRRRMRSYHLNICQDTESVAEHSHRAMIIAYLLVKKAGADPHKAMMMSAFHDMAETRTSDSNWVQKSYMEQDEEKATAAQLGLMGELAVTGNVEAQRRLDSENTSPDHLYTEEGKKWLKLVKKTDPTEWTRLDLEKSHGKYMRK